MAKKAAKVKESESTPVSSENRQKNIVVLRGSVEWKDWLHGLAEANHAPITVTIEQALREMSDRLKYRKPPRRTP
jgi:tripartite-type tricarboxylate transporter receptor subunit TctC